MNACPLGVDLGKQRDSLMNYLGELSKARPRGKSDDILMSEISRCDSELALVRDDLVRGLACCCRLSTAG